MFVTVWNPYQALSNTNKCSRSEIYFDWHSRVCMNWIFVCLHFENWPVRFETICTRSYARSFGMCRTNIGFSIERRWAVLFAECENWNIITVKGRGNGSRVCACVCVCEKVSSDHLNVKFLKGWWKGGGWVTNIMSFVQFVFISVNQPHSPLVFFYYFTFFERCSHEYQTICRGMKSVHFYNQNKKSSMIFGDNNIFLTW